ADAAAGHELAISAAERVAAAGAEVGERHPPGAADLGIQLVGMGSEALWRQPFRHGVRIGEGTVEVLGRGSEYAVQLDGAAHFPCSFNKLPGWRSLVERTGPISTSTETAGSTGPSLRWAVRRAPRQSGNRGRSVPRGPHLEDTGGT